MCQQVRALVVNKETRRLVEPGVNNLPKTKIRPSRGCRTSWTPKFRESNYLQSVSKMARSENTLDRSDNTWQITAQHCTVMCCGSLLFVLFCRLQSTFRKYRKTKSIDTAGTGTRGCGTRRARCPTRTSMLAKFFSSIVPPLHGKHRQSKPG